MITFRDGPAAGVRLQVRLAPMFLRAVSPTRARREWDALDQPGDEPRRGEMCFVYVLNAMPTRYFMRCTPPSAGGAFMSGEYVYLREFVPQGAMRDNESWREWLRANEQRLLPEWARAMKGGE